MILGMDPAVFWTILGVLLFVLEMLIPGFIVGSFGVGALAAALVSALGGELAIQLIVFAVISSISTYLLRRYFITEKPTLESAIDEMIGQSAICHSKIKGKGYVGSVKLNDTIWNARSDEIIHAGELVSVLERHGNTLTVTKELNPQ